MKITEALEVLNNSIGENIWNEFVPSLNREVGFKPLTVGKMKSLSKMLMDADDDDSSVIQLAMILESAIEPLNLYELNELDKLIILIAIKENNSIDEPRYKIKCPKCKTEFTTTLKYSQFKDKAVNIFTEDIDVNVTINNINYKVLLNIPSLGVLRDYNNFLKNTYKNISTLEETKEDKEKDIQNFKDYFLKYSYIMFIKNIFINDEEVEDYKYLEDFSMREKFTNALPSKLLEKINKTINSTDKLDINDNLYITVDCVNPKCDNNEMLNFGIEDFFDL